MLSRTRAWLVAAICMAVASVQFTSVAHAQKGERAGKSDPRAPSAAIEKKKKAREIDDAYKSALKGIPRIPGAVCAETSPLTSAARSSRLGNCVPVPTLLS
jgi:hypothetical protein